MMIIHPEHFFIGEHFRFEEKKSFVNIYRGESITQTYQNTDLTLSKVRLNDELYVKI